MVSLEPSSSCGLGGVCCNESHMVHGCLLDWSIPIMALSLEMLQVLDLMVDTIEEVSDAIPVEGYGRTYQHQRAEDRIRELRKLIDSLRPEEPS